ncbi:MAG: phospholipid carrier-dependent glycosyltransferase [Armatimonadota bacterium]|nr:phospholipid carrier-dependent glycosyltransferase [Armatimonadota bacterium]
MQTLKALLPWATLFGIAFAIRLIGIRWGLPNAEHHYSYHPDEWLLLLASYFVINPYAGEFLPRFYNYGTLPLYLWSLWLHWLDAAGVLTRLPQNPTPEQIAALRAELYLWARGLVALLGAGTAVVVGRALALVASARAGIVAGLAIAFAPAFVVHSRFQTVDVPTTFFVALAFHQSVATFRSSCPLRSLLWGAFWAGCAAGSKYNAGLALLAPLVSLWLLPQVPLSQRAAWSAAAVGTAGLTFLVVCPAIWADPVPFWKHFWYEVRHVGTGHGEVFTNTGVGWVYHLTPNLSTGFGALGLIASAVGWVLHWRQRTLWGVAVASLAYYLLIGAAEVRFLRYTFPLFPALAIGVGLCAISASASLHLLFARLLTRGLASVALLWQLISAVDLTLCMVRPDARDQAAAWLRANVPVGTSIGMPTVPWFYTPPLFPETGALRWQERLEYARHASPYRLVVLAPPEWNAEALRASLPEYLIITEFEERDVQRIGRADYKAFMEVVQQHYTLVRSFRNDPPLLGRSERMPHDLLYICPTVKVFRLAEARD